MLKPKAPCHGCEKREIGCRETCQGWEFYEKKYKEWWAKVSKELAKEKEVNAYLLNKGVRR